MRLPIVNPITRTKKQEGVFGGRYQVERPGWIFCRYEKYVL